MNPHGHDHHAAHMGHAMNGSATATPTPDPHAHHHTMAASGHMHGPGMMMMVSWGQGGGSPKRDSNLHIAERRGSRRGGATPGEVLSHGREWGGLGQAGLPLQLQVAKPTLCLWGRT